MLQLSVNLKELSPSPSTFIQQTFISQPAEAVLRVPEQVHRVETLWATNVFSFGTPSPILRPAHK